MTMKTAHRVFSEDVRSLQVTSCSMRGVSSHHGGHLFTKAPSEGRYNKAAVRALPVETSIETVSTGKYPREGGSEI